MSLAILPFGGAGYQGPIQGMIAMHGDMNTIAGLAITEEVETPGLGGRIEEPAWQAQFAGVKVRDANGELRFAVQHGPAPTNMRSMASPAPPAPANAMSQIIRFWMGPEGYGKFFDAVKRGEF